MKYRSVHDLYTPLYAEFGEKQTHKMRRQWTAEHERAPSYIELLAALSLEAGPGHKPPAMGRPRKNETGEVGE